MSGVRIPSFRPRIMRALLDGDIVAYRCAAICENEDYGLAQWHTEELFKRILKDTNASEYQIYLTGSDNFRYEVYPEYKANRRDKPRPRHWEPLKEHLIVNWNANMTHGCEADDMLGVHQLQDSEESIICSIDKDLLQIPGNHYNFVKQEIKQVTFEEAEYNFWYQMLVGDSADNIKGVPGIGPVKAKKILGIPGDWAKTVLGEYERLPDGIQNFIRTAKCLWIWRKENDTWSATEKLELDLQL